MSRRLATAVVAVALIVVAVVVVRVLTDGGDDAQADLGKLERSYPEKAPNIVVVMTDDQSADTMRAMPKTRKLLGEAGVDFNDAVVSFPLCCPSRAAFLTGQYAHNNGVRGNKPPEGSISALDEKETLAVWLRRAGYHTNFVGKYLNGYGKDKNGGKTYVPPGWVDWVALTSGDKTSAYDYDLNENGELVHYGDREQDYKTDVLARHARDVVREQAGRSRPFFLLVMTSAPHTDNGLPKNAPRNPLPAPRHRGDFDDAELPKPPSFNEADVSDKPPWVRRKGKIGSNKQREMERTYVSQLESLQSVDDMVETLVHELERKGALKETVVVFTSDNGYLRGQHRVSSGKSLVYEDSIGVPLLIRGPGFPARGELDGLAANIDLPASFLHAAGVDPGVPLDGVPLQPIAQGEQRRADVLLEIYGRKDGDVFGVRSDRFLFARHADGAEELYDLERDPHQLENVAGAAPYADVQRRHPSAIRRGRRRRGRRPPVDPHKVPAMTDERGSELEVRIRPFRAEDWRAVHRWFNNREAISSLMEVRPSFAEENAKGWTDAAVRAAEGEGEDRKWAIEVEGREEPVGFTALYGLFRQLAPELGALIGDDPGARGVGREAERLTVAKAFEELGAHRVYGRIPAFNEAAKKAVTWQGWTHEGTMPDHIRRPDGTLIDCEIWGITAPRWRRRWGVPEPGGEATAGAGDEPDAEADASPGA